MKCTFIFRTYKNRRECHEQYQNKAKCDGLNSLKLLSYTGCPKMNVPDFGRVFLMLKYTDIIQNT